jgi:hypothetical protein
VHLKKRLLCVVCLASAVLFSAVVPERCPAKSGVASRVGDSMQRPLRPRIMSPKKHARLRGRLPEVDDPGLQTILSDDRLILYTDTEMPRAYQNWSGQLQGVHSPDYNISANGSEPYGNANIEFPWGTPGGLHRAKNVSSFRFLWLPTDDGGEVLPVVWYRWRHSGDSVRGYEWIFPVGTVLGEVLSMRGPNGKEHVFELRVRIRDYGEWAVDVFRPFPTAGHLADSIKKARADWHEKPTLARLVGHLEGPIALKKHKLSNNHPRKVFVQSMGMDTLPPVDDDPLVVQLLTETTFTSASDVAWRESENGAVYTCAPTTTAAFHIVPANYAGGFVDVDPESCMRCHDSVGQQAQHFEFGRDWYGRVRGSDGIFSFHPFSMGSISHNGIGQAVSMRSELVKAKVLERFDPDKHPSNAYQRLESRGN